MMTPEEKGRRAQEILDSEVFQEAERSARQQIMDEWAAESSAARRESLWHQLQGGSPLTRALRTIAGRGEFAAHARQKQERRQANG